MKDVKVNPVLNRDALERVRASLKEGMSLAKYRQCGCMKEELESLRSSLESLKAELSLKFGFKYVQDGI